MTTASIAIVGAGPRGISILERIAARREDHSPAVDIHLIDDVQVGAGRVWDTDQTSTLCMNTLAGRVTLFTEPGATVTAPVVEGPTMYQWLQLLRGDDPAACDITDAQEALFRAHPADERVMATFGDEIRATVPQSNPTRALYGEYLRWVLDTVLARLPESVTVHRHAARVTGIRDRGDVDELTLRPTATESAQGEETLRADATVWAAGWVQPAPSAAEEEFAAATADAAAVAPRRRWIRPGNPIDQNYADIPAGECVLTRGLGMGFYDIMALSTIGRGGRFIADESARSGLHYEATGNEPHFVVTSRRGFPFFPKSDYGGLPPKATLKRTKDAIAALSGERDIDFATAVWPAIARDAYAAYFTTLARTAPDALTAPLSEIHTAIDAASPDELASATAPLTTRPFDLAEYAAPLAQVTADMSPDEVTAFIAQLMVWHIEHAQLGTESPEKAALWEISAARKPVSILGSPARFTRESRLGRYSEFMALGQMAGSGPPLFRFQQLLALVDAGLITFLGNNPQVTVTDAGFCATSGDRSVEAATLVDAWMYKPDIRRPGDELTKRLLADDRLRPFADHGVDTGSPETDDATRQTVHPDGSRDARLHLVGIPTYAQWPDTTISPLPGTDPLMLQETDKAAASLLRVAGA